MTGSERQLILTGIGGQGVQLAGQVLAGAALLDGRQAQMFQSYGGLMRGGQTEASVVVGDERVTAPPVLGSTWSAIALHHEYWEPVRTRVRPDGLIVANSSIVHDAAPDGFHGTTVAIAATDLAIDLGDVVLASMILLGAYNRVTSLVTPAALEQALHDALPTYRRDKAGGGVSALRAGAELEDLPAIPAWTDAVATA